MPTGYTADLYEGKDVSFEDFALNCARAFGAFASLRDEPDAKLPREFTVDEYYVKEFEKAEADLEKVKYMTDEDFLLEAEAVYVANRASLLKTIKEHKAIRSRYENMLQQVKAWEPPTDDHVGYKEFMINQLEESIKFDASVQRYEEELAELRKETVEEVRERMIEDAEWTVNYAKEKLKAAEVQAESRSAWSSALFESLRK